MSDNQIKIGTTQQERNSLRGQFLVAMPSLKDSMFFHSVTYICDHNEHGAMGVVVNQATHVLLNDVFEQLALPNSNTVGKMPVLAGGPVNSQQGFVLHKDEGKWDSTLTINSGICLTASKDIMKALASENGPQKAQFILGYAGWSPGQLEEELLSNSWLTVQADERIIFDTPIHKRWHASVESLGIDLDLISSSAGHA